MKNPIEFTQLIEETEVIGQLKREIREVPASLLEGICRKYIETNQPVPDYKLSIIGYIGETALSALTEAELIRRHPGGRLSLYAYEPTKRGLKEYERLSGQGLHHKHAGSKAGK